MAFSISGRRVWVAGHTGLVGSALMRRLSGENVTLLTVSRQTCDLRRQIEVEAWMRQARPEVIILAAATVGGILANDTRPVDFLYDNLMIAANILHAAHQTGVAKLLFLGSSCIYPKISPQPIPEEALLTGPLEPTNEAYAIAKIAGIKLCQAYRRQHGACFIAAMPTNLYGPGDNFDLNTSHVLPALMRKAAALKANGGGTLEVWGTGTPRREFLHVDDLADACVFLLRHYDDPIPINVGAGEDISIRDLATLVLEVVGARATLAFNTSRPDGTPLKLMDSTRMSALGWRPQIELRSGIASTYAWHSENPAVAT